MAGAKQNTKIGKDPRNTHWSNGKFFFHNDNIIMIDD